MCVRVPQATKEQEKSCTTLHYPTLFGSGFDTLSVFPETRQEEEALQWFSVLWPRVAPKPVKQVKEVVTGRKGWNWQVQGFTMVQGLQRWPVMLDTWVRFPVPLHRAPLGDYSIPTYLATL